MISFIVDSCDLSTELNYALIDAVVKGCNERVLLCIYDHDDNDVEFTDDDDVEDEFNMPLLKYTQLEGSLIHEEPIESVL